MGGKEDKKGVIAVLRASHSRASQAFLLLRCKTLVFNFFSPLLLRSHKKRREGNRILCVSLFWPFCICVSLRVCSISTIFDKRKHSMKKVLHHFSEENILQSFCRARSSAERFLRTVDDFIASRFAQKEPTPRF